MTNTTVKRIYFPHLDIVRFFAAFMIVILHSYEAWNGWFRSSGHLIENKYFNKFIGNFGIGVEIFFLLSGFLITYILLEEKKRFGKIHIWKFMMRRTIRIWPLYFLLIAISPFLVQWVNNPSPNYLNNILFIGNFDIMMTNQWSFPFAHFWSIAIEEHFYLIWPFIILLIPNKRLIPVFSGIILAVISFRIYTYLTSDNYWMELFLHTFSRIDVLIIGAFGAVFYSRKPFIIKLNKFTRFTLIILLILAMSSYSMFNWDGILKAAMLKYLYIGIAAVLLLDFNLNPNYKHYIPEKSIIHYFGKISYGIYMYGNILILIIIKKIMWVYQLSSPWAFFAIVFSLSIIIPILSYELFEKQLLKLNKYFKVIDTDR